MFNLFKKDPLRMRILKRTKKYIKSGRRIGLCRAIGTAIYRECGEFIYSRTLFPEWGNPEDIRRFHGDAESAHAYWWKPENKKDRIAYLDFLIEKYS